jgi:hypothetical protein
LKRSSNQFNFLAEGFVFSKNIFHINIFSSRIPQTESSSQTYGCRMQVYSRIVAQRGLAAEEICVIGTQGRE